ncbi:MAG: ABC transporter ATP-binding protein [Phycisphaerales bacterium]|nr:ABC transporter ATP-binding protein [Phycisphaerales bacterium]
MPEAVQSASPMIVVEHLSKSFGSLKAVDAVSFEVRRGETFGLLGPNGAGKSTAISIIVGALRGDSGTVVIDGRDIREGAAVRRLIGIAPQSVALYEVLSAERNLRFFGSLYGLAGDELASRVDGALRFAQLEDRRRDLVRTFSGGMKRRLNMACALVHDPQIILFDEPTVGVDPQSRNHIFECIEQLKADGRTIIYTTHYMEEAQRLCDRIAIMDHGRLLALDTLDGLLGEHGGAAVVTADLVRAPADASLLPATLDGLHLRFESRQPLEDVSRLATGGIAFATLNVARPDLESVFLSLTGRSLRD